MKHARLRETLQSAAPEADENDPLEGAPAAGTGLPAGGELRIASPLYGGTFAAQDAAGGSAASLPFVLPGETATAAPTLRILAASPDRVVPPCPYFGPCGGCQYQHASYPAQLRLKEEILRALLLPIVGLERSLPKIHTHGDDDPWRYRNRVRLRVEQNPQNEGAFLLGYNHRATNTLLPIADCPISAPLLLHAGQSLLALAPADANVARWLRATAELELFTPPDESRVQMTLLLRGSPAIPSAQQARSFAQLCGALQRSVPELAGAGAELLRATRANSARPHAGRRASQGFTPPAWGSPGLLYPLRRSGVTGVPDGAEPAAAAAEHLWVSRGSFFQANRHLVETLVRVATHAAARDSPGALAWDLFAGAGLFTRTLAQRFERVTAVESSASATADLAAGKLRGVRIITGTVLAFLQAAVLDRDRPGFVLLDPPRAGLGVEGAALLARLQPAHIVYVSCDPTTLARDLRAMLSSGYNLAELHLVDMFPQTFHLETVAVLTRA